MATKSTNKKVAIGLGVAAVAAAAAGVYFFATPQGKKQAKVIGAWANKAKLEVAKRLKKAEKVTKATYMAIVKDVMAKYKDAKNVAPDELKLVVADLQKHWTAIEKDVKKHIATVGKTVGKATSAKAKK